MECKKCNINISSDFQFVLAQNICPKCGSKLMADGAMKVYIELKKRLQEEIELVCERISMFMIANYELISLHNNSNSSNIKTKQEGSLQYIEQQQQQQQIENFKTQLASIEADENLSPEEIREQEAARAEELSLAREMGMDIATVIDDEGNEKMVSGKLDDDRIKRLKKAAAEALAKNKNTFKIQRIGSND